MLKKEKSELMSWGCKSMHMSAKKDDPTKDPKSVVGRRSDARTKARRSRTEKCNDMSMHKSAQVGLPTVCLRVSIFGARIS